MPESVGIILKNIRESKKYSPQEVSEKTRIPKNIILAIEEDNIHNVLDPYYAKRFVKSYAQFLSAQEEKIVREYLSGTKEKDNPLPVGSEPEKIQKIDWNKFKKYKKHIGVGILIFFSVWLFFFTFLHLKKFAGHVIAERKAKIHLPKPAQVKPVAAAKTAAADKHGTAPDKAGPSETKLVSAAKEREKKQDIEIEIKADSDAWLQVKGDGVMLFRGILKKGESDVWRSKKEIKLELGNAGGVQLKFNGEALGPQGKKGEKKEIRVTKDGVVY